VIVGSIGWEATGHVYLYGYSVWGFYSDLQVWVSNDYQNWDQVGYTQTITDTSPYWIDVGTPSGTFRYIAIVGYDSPERWLSVCLYLDSVRVTP